MFLHRNPFSLTLCLGLLLPGILVFAQEAAPLSEVVSKARVLDSQEVDLGPRSIIYNRLETPALKPQPTPATAPTAQRQAAPTAEELAAIREWEAKTDVFLFLSCTVFDRKVTEVRWWREDGEYVVWSGIDFNYLRGILDFETDTTRYSIFLGIGDESMDSLREWNAEVDRRGLSADLKRSLPVLPVLATSPPQYRIVSNPKTGIAPEAKAAFDAIHQYFHANRERLVREFEASEEARIAHEEWLKANPPQPKDTTVNFFPIKSRTSAQTSTGVVK